MPEIIKVLDENQQKVHDMGIGSDFMGMTLKAQATKGKIGKWDYIKLKNLRASKDRVNRGTVSRILAQLM